MSENESVSTRSEPVVDSVTKVSKCTQCRRPFKTGDYLYVIVIGKQFLCRICFGPGKGYPARLFVFANDHSSSVSRDRLNKRLKKLRRSSKKS